MFVCSGSVETLATRGKVKIFVCYKLQLRVVFFLPGQKSHHDSDLHYMDGK